MKYYVYVAKIDGVVVYVGAGKGDRYSVIVSGKSHNYLANKAHFSNEAVTSEIFEFFDDKSAALSFERCLILLHQPPWNIIYNTSEDVRLGRNITKRSGSTSKYKGVKRSTGNNKKNPWKSYIHKGDKYIHIGMHATEEEAARAVEEYVINNP